MSTFLTAAAWVALAILGVLYANGRKETRRLRRRLEGAAQELERLQVSFSRFAPQQVIEKIIESGVPTTGEKKEVSILFADLVGFTELSENVEPTTLVRILNGYFECMERAIADHRGYVSSLVGDGILALFGALEPNPWQASDAVHAALAMRRELATYNEKLVAEGLRPLAVGVGLHRGLGVAGLVGSRDLMEFTVVGRTINLAARIQDLTRTHDADIIVSDSIHEALDPRFRTRPLPPCRVKGVADEIVIHGVDDWAPAGGEHRSAPA
jgi:adenylate cyclase